MNKMNKKNFNKLSSIPIFILSSIAVAAFWYFRYIGYDYGSQYATIGHFIAAHGALIYIICWQYLVIKERSVIEQLEIWFKKKK
jgi:hypothetical protein